MHFKINHSDVSLIANVLVNSDLASKFVDVGECVENGKYPTGRYVIDLSRSEAEFIIEHLSNLLMNSGLDDKGELNPVGQQVETLIDIFGSM